MEITGVLSSYLPFWMDRYPIYMLETFVEKRRFRGTYYQAANRIYVGQTRGCSRNDRYATLNVLIKDIYLYPLVKRFQEALVIRREHTLLIKKITTLRASFFSPSSGLIFSLPYFIIASYNMLSILTSLGENNLSVNSSSSQIGSPNTVVCL